MEVNHMSAQNSVNTDGNKYFNNLAIGRFYPDSGSEWTWSVGGSIIVLPCFSVDVTDDFTFDMISYNNEYLNFINGNNYTIANVPSTAKNPYANVAQLTDDVYIQAKIIFPNYFNGKDLLNLTNIDPTYIKQISIALTMYDINNNVQHSASQIIMDYEVGSNKANDLNYLTLALNTYSPNNKYQFYGLSRYRFNPPDTTMIRDGYTTYLNHNSVMGFNWLVPSSLYIDYNDLGSTPS